MTASVTKQNEIIGLMAASRHELQLKGMGWNWAELVTPILLDMGIRPISAAPMNLRKSGLIKRVARGKHRLTRAGRYATIALGKRPWRKP